MSKNPSIAITGACGFIGSQIANHMAKNGRSILCVDHKETFSRPYLKSLKYSQMDSLEFIEKIPPVEMIVHMGAISSTSETDWNKLLKWNVEYTKKLWEYCTKNKIPFVYASSGATFGDGKLGFSDSDETTLNLKPLNLYGKSKHEFDLFALKQTSHPSQWLGLKFFNVYGPHEDHKGRQGSSIFNGFWEIKKSGAMTLFKSHNPDYKDGEQSRDFIYIKDILAAIDHLLDKKCDSGIYNLGSGKAQNYIDLSTALFKGMKLEKKINWIDTPMEFRAAYQYKTEAEVTKIRAAGFVKPFTDLNLAVSEYLQYLNTSPNTI